MVLTSCEKCVQIKYVLPMVQYLYWYSWTMPASHNYSVSVVDIDSQLITAEFSTNYLMVRYPTIKIYATEVKYRFPLLTSVYCLSIYITYQPDWHSLWNRQQVHGKQFFFGSNSHGPSLVDVVILEDMSIIFQLTTWHNKMVVFWVYAKY